MNSEPEVGSVIESRIDAFAQADQRIALGHIERICAVCGKAWRGPDYCRQGDCTSHEFEERDVRPTPIEFKGWGEGARPTIATVKEKVPSKLLVGVEDLFALRSLRTALVDVENRLLNADARLHQLVNFSEANFALFGFLQQALHGLTDGNIGDFELRSISPLTAVSLLGPIRSLRAEIDRVLARYEEEKAKK
jgi:hypothetical protein